MDWTAIAIVGATLTGPVVAVVITTAWQISDRRYQRKMEIFRAMMRYRRHHLSPEWVGSLNLVPVEFSKHKEVFESFNRLLDTYQDVGFLGTPEQVRRAGENAEVAASQLLLRMAATLKLNLHGLDLRRAYAPQGWATDEDANRSLRNFATMLVSGKAPLHVVLDEPAGEPPTGTPQANVSTGINTVGQPAPEAARPTPSQ